VTPWNELGPQCEQNAHTRCPHYVTGGGGGLNPRRLRLEFGVQLCRCSCHEACPATSNRLAVPFKVWQESCTCPAAEQERQRQRERGFDPPDFAGLRQEAEHKRRERRAAYEAASRASDGKSKAEIQEIYADELRARNLQVPQQEFLSAVADRILGNPLPSYMLLGQSCVRVGKQTAGLFRDIRKLLRDMPDGDQAE
jgi:hypothetical protein